MIKVNIYPHSDQLFGLMSFIGSCSVILTGDIDTYNMDLIESFGIIQDDGSILLNGSYRYDKITNELTNDSQYEVNEVIKLINGSY